MNQDIKSKADALKYAIEFTAEDGKPNYNAAQELYDFIRKNLSVSEDTVNEARLHTQKRIDEIVMHTNACIDSLLRYSRKHRPSVIAEGTKEKEEEEDGTVPCYPNSISEEINYIQELLHKRGYKFVSGMSSKGFGEMSFLREDDNESLEVITKKSSKLPQSRPDTIVSNDTEAEIADVKRYLLARGYKMTAGVNEPEKFVHPELNIKIAFV
ncbi:MAG: hypothetical protein IKM47_06480 [Bacteroidaceae bacterium]|nr:hypothetical protein [Bacteroidaceae bacterium]